MGETSRRSFCSLSLKAMAMAVLAGRRTLFSQTGGIVDTPEKRKAYLARMLDELCVKTGPRAAGTPGYDKAALLIQAEMKKSLPRVELDWFAFDQYVPEGMPVLSIGDKTIEAYPLIPSPVTPEKGVSGVLAALKDHYAIVDAKTGAPLAEISLNGYGMAVPRNYYDWETGANTYEGRPAVCAGKKDEEIFQKAVKEKAKASLSFSAKTIKNAKTCNIVGTLPGETKEEILVMAHADSHYNTAGALDNAASAITVIMLAHAFAGKKPKRTLTFMPTAAEEIGCLGAKHYAERRKAEGTLSDIKICLNFDSLTYGPNFQLCSADKDLIRLAQEAQKQYGQIGVPKISDKNGSLDEMPFWQAGARALYVNTRGYDWTLPLWHRPEDTPDKVKPELVENAFSVFKGFLDSCQNL